MTVDFIIVGQGIAGTMMGLQLQRRGQSFTILDAFPSKSSSKIAAGIVNPVTGRRFVKSWMYEELIEEALTMYQGIERLSGQVIIKPVDIIRTLMDHRTQNDWARKRSRTDFEGYISDEQGLKGFERILKSADYSVGIVKGGYKVEIATIVDYFKNQWLENQVLMHDDFEHSALKFELDAIHYKDIAAKHIIFCEGFRFRDNPFFKIAALQPSKGEVLIVHAKNHELRGLFKRKYFYVPIDDNRIWYGASNSWDVDDEEPTHRAFDKLRNALESQIGVPFHIADHLAAIRPTVIDRRPLIGTHPTLHNVHVFNGLGTKGASLAPYWSGRLVNHILDGLPLHSEVNIRRFF